MGRVAGKVALITGAARGQGRAHAVRLAEEGADIIAVDLASPDEADFAETVELVEKHGRRIFASRVDVRGQDELDRAVAEAVGELGRLDIVVANAGILTKAVDLWEMAEERWQAVLEVNLGGVFHTAKAAVPHMIAAGNGGSVVLVSSAAGLKGAPSFAGYSASKHGVVGLARSLAMELGPRGIRVNSVHPGSVDTGMIMHGDTFKALSPGLERPTKEDVASGFASTNLLPVPWLEPSDIANAVLWLASDEARYVTGIALPVDAGMAIK